MANKTLRAVIKRNGIGGLYVQVLEHDLAAEGRDLDAALHELARIINVHVGSCKELGREPFVCLEPAPVYYFGAFHSGTPLGKMSLPDLKPVELGDMKAELAVA